MEGDGIRLSRMSLLDQISVMECSNLRDLLKVREDDDALAAGSAGLGGAVTLGSILESEKRGGRTLLDIIREENESQEGALPESSDGTLPEREVRISLMTLLALTEGLHEEDTVSSAAASAGSGVVVAVADKEEIVGAVAMTDDRIVCCVCMVRKKGAAFIPCGHTFCRVCSRDLWTDRRTCPLCNSFILDILDIF